MEDNTTYTREGVKLLVEEQDGKLEITHMDIELGDLWQLVIYLVSALETTTGQRYNDILEDLKEIEGED